MPLFMDVHTVTGGIDLNELAAAHQADLDTQDAYDVQYLRYWVDEDAGKIFCLVEADSPHSAATVHREAHGLVADEIYRVSATTGGAGPAVLQSRSGKVHDVAPPPTSTTTRTDTTMRTTTERDRAHDELPTHTAVVANPVTQTDTAAVPSPSRQSDAPWIAVGLAAAAALVVASIVWLSGASGEPTSTDPVVSDAVVDTIIAPAEALERLVARGYVPPQAVGHEQAVSTALVRQGLVPGGRFDDPALHDLQTRGLVPRGVTVDEDGALRDLQVRGLVPNGRFDDPALRDLQSRGHVPSARGSG